MEPEDLSNVDDLASLEELDDEVLLRCLKQRFLSSHFYVSHYIYNTIFFSFLLSAKVALCEAKLTINLRIK